MSLQSTEQIVHDRINLGRLVKRLEKSAEDEAWSQDDGHNTWIKTRGTLQA
jgi:SNARE protein 1